MTIGGQPWQLLSRQRAGSGTSIWHFQNRLIRDPTGELAAGSLALRLRRRVSGCLHDDLSVSCFVPRGAQARLVIQIDADFADVFEVKEQRLPPRLSVRRDAREYGLSLSYRRGSFCRGLQVALAGPAIPPQIVGSRMIFDLDLEPGGEWRCCVDAEPQIDGEPVGFEGDPHSDEMTDLDDSPHLRGSELLERPFRRGCADLQSLVLPNDDGAPYVAAGVPWFMALFGRDTLMSALMTGITGSWPAVGALASLQPWQARERDDWRDAEPGKIPHELRRGELASFGDIPHSPYYGTHDAPALYCLAVWHAWRWTGGRALLDAYLPTARAALAWCDEWGDRDGDGLLEYATRSRRGYYNQGWKDAADAILRADGGLAPLPLGTVELQGYLYAARLAIAELLETTGEQEEAARLRRSAAALRAMVEGRYWVPDSSYYALALDGAKRPVTTIASNPGHLLWCGLPSRDRAEAVARRLVAPDMFTGWGIRTLSAEHPRYNPLSYQRGSVWPHDTVLAAAGLTRYGFREEAWLLLRGILEAARALEDDRLPELFCGFDRALGLPVPYAEANIPQAWAAAAPILAVQLLLGLVPDASRNRCSLSPWLPEGVRQLEVRGIALGSSALSVSLKREGDRTVLAEVQAPGLDVAEQFPAAPLWGAPIP